VPTQTEEGQTQSDRTWTVRQLADELGVTTRTLRFYEAEGLVSPQRDGTNRSTPSATAPGCG
jgi:hypothetical protein